MGQLLQAIDPFLFVLPIAYGQACRHAGPTVGKRSGPAHALGHSGLPASRHEAHRKADAASNTDAIGVIGPYRMDARYKPLFLFQETIWRLLLLRAGGLG